jgi:Holliday junction resolvase RusA-like endonuclease
MKLIIKGKLATANEYIGAIAVNRFAGGSMKKRETLKVYVACKEQKLRSVGHVTEILFDWYVKNKKKDKDNVAFSKKFILDGLQMAGVIKNDTWDMIGDFADRFYVDKNERVEVEIL